MSPLSAVDEQKRIEAVAGLELFDRGHIQPAFDDAVFLASVICDTPVSLITMLDGKHQHFIAKVGTDLCMTKQDESFCIHAIQQPELFVIPDTHLDDRFRDSPLVTKDPNVRFYAGMPLATSKGDAVGTLCVLDTVPRQLSDLQKRALSVLSRRVAAHFEDRERMVQLKQIIADKERTEQALRSSNALFEAFMDNSPLIGFMKNETGLLVYYNQSFARHFRITRDEWIGRDEFEFFPAEVAADLRQHDDEIMENKKLNVMEVTIPEPDGTIHEFRTYKFAFVNAAGERFLAGMSHEITAEKKAHRELEATYARLHELNEELLKLSITDALTGCRNRRSFDDRLNQEFVLAERFHFRLSVLLLDIDDFKAVNDTYGHEEGDRVLKHVARQLEQGVRDTDIVCRYGGEEFAILLPHTSRESAFQLADRLRASVEAAWGGVNVTVSVGVGTWRRGMKEPAALTRDADAALYKAKAAGKNRVVLAAA